MARARRSYTRDSRGRFASTPGGPARAASGLPKRQARKMGTPPPRRRGLVTQRAAVRRSAAKLKGLDVSGSYSGAMKQRGQRAAVTRAANRLQAARQSGRRRLRAGAQQGVIRSRQRPATGKPAVPKRLQRSEAEQAHRDKIARQTKALPKEVRRAIGVARYGKSRPGVSEYRSFLGGKKLTTHELRGHLRDAGTRLILGIPAYGRRKLNKAERAKEAAMILEGTKMLRARLAMGPVRGKVRIRMPRSAGTVAKPKGLRPGVLAERRGMRAKPARRGKARIGLAPTSKTGIMQRQAVNFRQFWRMAQKAQVPIGLQDWGGRDRKQGKRIGNMIIGSMSAAPRGIVPYPDFRRARGMTPKIWKEVGLMEDEAKRATIGALQAGWRPIRALRLGYLLPP